MTKHIRKAQTALEKLPPVSFGVPFSNYAIRHIMDTFFRAGEKEHVRHEDLCTLWEATRKAANR